MLAWLGAMQGRGDTYSVVPAKAGTDNHRGSLLRESPSPVSQIARARSMGPRFRGDDTENHSLSAPAA